MYRDVYIAAMGAVLLQQSVVNLQGAAGGQTYAGNVQQSMFLHQTLSLSVDAHPSRGPQCIRAGDGEDRCL